MAKKQYDMKANQIEYDVEFISIQDIINGTKESPFPTTVFPNNMGINLCSVEGFTVKRQKKDNQIKSITIDFIPFNPDVDYGYDEDDSGVDETVNEEHF